MNDQQDLIFPERSPLEIDIMRLLDEHIGLQQAIPMEELAAAVGVDARTLQEHIKHLIEEHREPIGSSTVKPNGYYLIETAADQLRAVKQIDSRIISLAKRKARMVGHTPQQVLLEITGQLDLEIPEATHA